MMRNIIAVMFSCLMVVVSVTATAQTSNAQDYILEQLTRQKEEKARKQEEKKKLEMEQRYRHKTPDNIAKDPRSASASEAYPALKKTEKEDIAKVCDIKPLQPCKNALKLASSQCDALANNCKNDVFRKEHPSCKQFSCEAEKAACMKDAYGAYQSCLEQVKMQDDQTPK